MPIKRFGCLRGGDLVHGQPQLGGVAERRRGLAAIRASRHAIEQRQRFRRVRPGGAIPSQQRRAHAIQRAVRQLVHEHLRGVRLAAGQQRPRHGGCQPVP